jgi:DNA-binding HxlR family transcriptional regulator
MSRADLEAMECPIARTLSVIGDRWTPLILRDIYAGITRFDAIHANLGVSRKVLTQRLSGLVNHGVVERVPYQDNPVRYDYQVTDKGLELGAVLLAMKAWGDRWTGAPEGAIPSMQVVHERCGTMIESLLSCPECGEQLHPSDLAIVPTDTASRSRLAARR